MPGSTGKMTREAIEARGPRMALYKIYNPRRDSSILLISRLTQAESPFTDKKSSVLQFNFIVVSRSYSLSYLMNVARGNK